MFLSFFAVSRLCVRNFTRIMRMAEERVLCCMVCNIYHGGVPNDYDGCNDAVTKKDD